jgi:Putative adhesin
MTARTGWLMAGAVLTMIAVTLGPATVGLWLARQTETQHQAYQHAGGALTVESGEPDIRVVPGRAGEVTVERTLVWAAGKPRVAEEWDGETLRITAECSRSALARSPIGPRCDVDYTLRVPPDVLFAIRGGHGDLVIDGIDGRLSAQTTSGDITAASLRCTEADLRTTSGDVRARFSLAPERVDAATTAGDIELAVPPDVAYRLHIDAADQQLGIPHNPNATRTITARTDQGSVRLK